MFNGKVIRSNDIKDVIHIRVKKFAGYFNPESRSFAVDPHLTTFDDLQKILIEAFNLTGPFHITYLCRDDAGESVFLSMLTDWDLDAAFMTSSEPYLRLKLDAEPYKDGLMTKIKGWDDSPSNIFKNHSNLVKNILQPVTSSALFQTTPKSWANSLGGAFNRLTSGWSNSAQEMATDEDFYPVKPPLDDAEFRNFLGEDGRLTNPEGLRLRIYNGGVAPALRKVIWRLILNIFPDDLTGKERIEYIRRKSDEYERLRSKWQAKAGSGRVKRISSMVWEDVLRTDRSHAFFKGSDDNPNIMALMNILTTFALTHPQVSYCQGMSDLVSPILVVMNNEAQAYICFCGLMARIRSNFTTHGKVMSTKFKHLSMLVQHYDVELYGYLRSLGADNMFFCYRWVLLEMKREFSFDDAITVLEVIWSSLPPHPPDADIPLEDYSQSVTPSPEEDDWHHCADEFPRPEIALKQSQTGESGSENVDTVSDNPLNTVNFNSKLSTSDNNGRDSPKVPHNGSGAENREENDQNNEDSLSIFEDLIIEGDVDFSNPRGDKRTTEPKAIESDKRLPPPEELGCGHPFLLFVCLAVLLQEREEIISSKLEYDAMVMHFDKMVRKHSPKKVLSKAMKLFAEYLRSDLSFSSSST